MNFKKLNHKLKGKKCILLQFEKTTTIFCRHFGAKKRLLKLYNGMFAIGELK